MTIDTQRLDDARLRVLDRMEAGRRLVRLGTGAAALLEAAMLVACIVLVDWQDRIRSCLPDLSQFLSSSWGCCAAGHVTAATARILAALDARADEGS